LVFSFNKATASHAATVSRRIQGTRFFHVLLSFKFDVYLDSYNRKLKQAPHAFYTLV
jgi:hypothetical protein